MKSDRLAAFLEAQYADFNDDLPFWFGLAQDHAQEILELGCGAGRVLLQLAAAGYTVTGLDHLPAMLARLRRHIDPASADRVTLLLGDMADFQMDTRLGLIICPCNTFANLNDRQAQSCLASAHASLLPGGCLALDTPNPGQAARLATAEDEPLTGFIDPDSGHPIQLSAVERWLADDRLHVAWLYDELHPDGRVTRQEIESFFYLRSPAQVRQWLVEAGYRSTRFLGGYDRRPLTPTSDRMLILATRAD
jgi:SAM-dependent methyltransferase